MCMDLLSSREKVRVITAGTVFCFISSPSLQAKDNVSRVVGWGGRVQHMIGDPSCFKNEGLRRMHATIRDDDIDTS